MTPEQILIDGLKYINTYDLAGDDALADCTLRQRAGEFLEAYNEAKAKENNSAPNAPEITSYLRGRLDKEAGLNQSTTLPSHPDQATFTLTAEEYDKLTELLDAPARELPELKRLFSKSSVLEGEAQAQDLLTAAPLAEALREVEYGHDPDCISDRFYTSKTCTCSAEKEQAKITKALTQAETLIKHSEAVWAVVEAARELIEKVHRTKWHPNWGEDRDMAEEHLREAVEALEMMEGKDNA